MAEDERTAQELLMDEERKLILGARDTPDKTIMPGTEQTVTEYRRERELVDLQEGQEALNTNREVARALSRASDDRYTGEAEVVLSSEGLGRVIQREDAAGRQSPAPDPNEAKADAKATPPDKPAKAPAGPPARQPETPQQPTPSE